MKIFIMRHGEAEMLSKSDEMRQLTEYGKQSCFSQGEWLKSHQLKFDKVLVSPYVRAQQTFLAVNQAYQQILSPQLEIWKGIVPNGNAQNVVNYLSVLLTQGVENVLIISHLPLVSEILLELCGSNNVSFFPATLAEVDWNGITGNMIQTKRA